ncbi:metalloregulator ArsR/SmtB family transcription factor [soil metagenome]
MPAAAPSPFSALAEPNRRDILDVLLFDGSQTVGQLVDRLELSQPLVSKHLRTLLAAGLVEARSEGRNRRYRVRVDGLVEIEDWLEPHRQFWAARLDQLAAHLDAIDPADPTGPASPTDP